MIDDPLRRRSLGAPAARSALLTILGEYVLPRRDGVWQETLVAALRALGYNQQAARQALTRSVRDRWLINERHGRRARMHLTGATAELLNAGARRIYNFGDEREWDGMWLVVVLRVPESRRDVRHQLRTKLAWAGLGSLGGGVWITPHTDREAEVVDAVRGETAAEVLSLHSRIGALGDARSMAEEAWNLESVASAYEAFIVEFSPLPTHDPESCFAAQTALVHSWRRFPFLDPDLPRLLLPARWPRRRAHELFRDRHARWEQTARACFEAWEAGVGGSRGSG